MLATDRWAGVGWAGAALPLGASYRPVPVTLGVLGLWLGLLAGLSAALAGRLPRRAWWPLHKIAAVSLALVWTHGVLAGSDTPALLAMYVISGMAGHRRRTVEVRVACTGRAVGTDAMTRPERAPDRVPAELLGANVHFLPGAAEPLSELAPETLSAHHARLGARPDCTGARGRRR